MIFFSDFEILKQIWIMSPQISKIKAIWIFHWSLCSFCIHGLVVNFSILDILCPRYNCLLVSCRYDNSWVLYNISHDICTQFCSALFCCKHFISFLWIIWFINPYFTGLHSSLRYSDLYIYVSKLTTIGSDNGLSPYLRQAIIWTNDGILLIRTLGTKFNGILSETHLFSFKKMHLKMLSGKCHPFCLGLNIMLNVFGAIVWLTEYQWSYPERYG